MKLLDLAMHASRVRRLPVLALLLAVLLPACDAPSEEESSAELRSWGERHTKRGTEDTARGLWRDNPWAEPAAADEALADRIRQLETLGYTGGTEPVPGVSGVVRYDPDQAFNGYQIVLSSHTTEARMIDMLGRSLHVWSIDPNIDWPDFEDEFKYEGDDFEIRKFFHRAHLYPNGDLLAMIYAYGLFKLDRDSNILWRTQGPVHHDMDVTEDGTVYVLDRKAGIKADIHPTEVVLDELISVYSPDGELQRQISILDAFRNSDFSPALRSARRHGEILHSNTLHVLDGRFADRNPAFKAGNILTSFRHLDAIAIVDMETEQIVWFMRGLWRMQHDPRFTDKGTMTVYDNRGVAHLLPGTSGHIGSRIIEFDPITQEVVWTFTGNNEEQFYSDMVGSAMRLPNGNTLICESRRGRYLEVTPGHEVVWEYVNPNQAGPENQYIAELYGVLRFAPEYVSGWLDTEPADEASGISGEPGHMDEPTSSPEI